MMEKVFGEYANEVRKVFQFIMGEPHEAMAWVYILALVNLVIASFREKTFKFVAYLEKVFAYTAFIILGNIVDRLAVENVFQGEGSTQLLICIYLVIREAGVIKDYLTARYGINIPILNQRMARIEQHAGGSDPQTLNARIDTLRRELGELEQQQQETPAEEERT